MPGETNWTFPSLDLAESKNLQTFLRIKGVEFREYRTFSGRYKLIARTEKPLEFWERIQAEWLKSFPAGHEIFGRRKS